MPCLYDVPPSPTQVSGLEQELQAVRTELEKYKLAFEALTILDEDIFKDLKLTNLYQEACKRIKGRKAIEEIRAAAREEEARRAALKKAALDKLTPEERRILGV